MTFFENLMNYAAEQGLLSAIMADNNCFWEIHGAVRAEDFSSPVHGEIFQRCADLIIEGKSATPITLSHAFANHPDLQTVGGSAYLAELLASVITVVNAPDYARVIADLAERRSTLAMIEDAKRALVSEDRTAAEITAELVKSIAENSGKSSSIKTKREVAMEAIGAIQLPPDCYPTGLACLDKVMGGGLYAGYTYGLAGAEKRGKTTLAHTISHNLNEAGILHAYIALEMGSRQIEQRNLARMADVNSLKFLQPNTRNDTVLLQKVSRLAAAVKNNTLYLDMPGGTLDQIQVELSRMVSKHRIKGFILDYWQLVEGQQKGETEERHLRRVSQWLANFSRKHGIWCILLSQVNADGNLFVGKGLVKACDQLYIIELADAESQEQEIWLKMTHRGVFRPVEECPVQAIYPIPCVALAGREGNPPSARDPEDPWAGIS